MKTITLLFTNSMKRSPMRNPFLLIALLLVWFEVSPKLQAVNPPPDGGYSSGNTAEGTEALFHLTAGGWNTALGFRALYSTEAGQKNTATGYNSLLGNTTGHDNTANGVAALITTLLAL